MQLEIKILNKSFFKELYEQFLFNNFLIKRLFSIYKKNYYFFLSVVIFV
jgi:hypothetical protein